MVMAINVWSSTPMCYFVQSDVSKPKQRFDLIDYMFADVHYQENFLHTIS